MSVHSHSESQERSLLETSESNEVPAHELSGDENAQRSVLLSDIRVEKASFFMTIMTIMKTVIGVGVLGLPYAVSEIGLVLSAIIFTATMLLTQYSSTLLLKVKNLSHHSNYSTIAFSISQSRWFESSIYFMILFNNVGICTAQLTIFKEILGKIVLEFKPEIGADYWAIQSWFTVGICLSLVLVVPICFQEIQKLRYFALIGIGAVSVFIVCVIYNFFKEMADRNWEFPMGLHPFVKDDPFKAIASIPNILLAFLYQMNFFPIYKGIRHGSDAKMVKASWISGIACYFIYICMGFLGYLTYGDNPERPLQTNFLRALRKSEIGTVLFILMNGVFMISVACSFPIIFFGARNNLIALTKAIFGRTERTTRNSRYMRSAVDEISDYIIDTNKERKKRKAKILFFLVTGILFVTIVTLAVTVGRLGPIFNLVGAIASNSIGFIFPTLFYIILIIQKKRKKTISFYFSLLLLCTSVPFAIFAVITEFIE